ncbi:hypothetical protein LOAG_02560 [Loa loa]|uniref:Uncharacterized protein n=1 Tax=Loa loa TaxID=7209 RepID=A0A1S0U683_LOALO|nr:hypothetical protein LOAG_02560 [Loa loa]EFO25926.1 hypothetical protein LOAG_02560 [Loa loa]
MERDKSNNESYKLRSTESIRMSVLSLIVLIYLATVIQLRIREELQNVLQRFQEGFSDKTSLLAGTKNVLIEEYWNDIPIWDYRTEAQMTKLDSLIMLIELCRDVNETTAALNVLSQYVYFPITVIEGKPKRNNLLSRAVAARDIN